MEEQSTAKNGTCWHVRMFGRMEVVQPNGEVLPLRGKKAGELLAYLLLHSTTSQEKSDLVKCLWQDRDPVSARTRLRQELSNLRAALASETETASTLFDATRQTIQVCVECFTTDVQQFQECLKQARLHSEQADRLKFLIEATQLYRADLLTEYSDWVLPLRVDLLTEYEQALAEIAVLRQEFQAQDTHSVPAATNGTSKANVTAPVLPLSTPKQNEPPISVSDPIANRQKIRGMSAALALLALLFVGRSLWRSNATAKPLPKSPALILQSAAEPPLEYGKEKWVYTYKPRQGEKPNSEAKAICGDEEGNFYVTGLIEVKKGKEAKEDNVDILTVKLSENKGKKITEVWAARYSSPEGDCDRAFAITRFGQQIYVAGETYVPASKGVEEGWHTTLICYDTAGHQLWVRRSPMTIKNDQTVKLAACPNSNVIVAATGIHPKQAQIVVMCWTPQGKLLWHQYVAPKPTQSTTLSGLQLLTAETVGVSGTVTIGEGKSELNTDWFAASVDIANGKTRWSRPADSGGHGADTAVGIGSDRYGFITVGGIFSMPHPAGSSRYSLGLMRYDAKGIQVWRKELPISDGKGLEHGSFCLWDKDGTATVAANQVEPTKLYSPRLMQYSFDGVQHWEKEIKPSTDLHRQEILMMTTIDGFDRLCLCGTLSGELQPAFVPHRYLWTVFLDRGGRIAGQYFFPRGDAGTAFPNALMQDGAKGMIIAGQRDPTQPNAAFLVLKYSYPVRWK